MKKTFIFVATSVIIGIILLPYTVFLSVMFFLLAFLSIINKMTSRRIASTKKGPFSITDRNYQVMVVGGKTAFVLHNLANTKSNRFLNLSAPAHTVYGMTLAVKRYYSFTAENAVIKLVIDLNSELSDKLNIYDVACLHRVTLGELGISNTDRRVRLPIIFEPKACLDYMVYILFGCSVFSAKKKITEKQMDKAISQLNELNDFLSLRGRKLMITAICANNEIDEILISKIEAEIELVDKKRIADCFKI